MLCVMRWEGAGRDKSALLKYLLFIKPRTVLKIGSYLYKLSEMYAGKKE